MHYYVCMSTHWCWLLCSFLNKKEICNKIMNKLYYILAKVETESSSLLDHIHIVSALWFNYREWFI